MWKYNFKIALRALLRNKATSLINILGLTISFTIIIFIFLYVKYEYSYDQFHKNADLIYRFAEKWEYGGTKINWTATPAPLKDVVLDIYPEIEGATRISYYNMHGDLLKYKDQYYDENKILAADSSFFNIFSFKVISGNVHDFFSEEKTAVVTERIAKKLIGSVDVINEIIYIEDTPFRITGVLENIPKNSHFTFDVLLNITTFEFSRNPSWGASNVATYIKLKKSTNADELKKKFDFLARNYMYKNDIEKYEAEDHYFEFYLQKMTDIHLYSHIEDEYEVNGNADYVRIFVFVAFFILLIACINYVNLTTAKSTLRSKEIGIKKVVGSQKLQIVKSFLLESVLISVFSFVFAMTLVESLLPFIEELTNKTLAINYFNHSWVLFLLMITPIIIGMLAGIYPGFVLSTFKPILVLKGNTSNNYRNISLRNILVVFQFITSVILIIVTIHVYRQLEFLQNKELGFAKDEVLIIENPELLDPNENSFKNELLNETSIKAVSFTSKIPGSPMSKWSFKTDEKKDISFNLFVSDFDFHKVYDLKITEGRFFGKDYSDNDRTIVINQKAVDVLGFQNPIGRKLYIGKTAFEIIGVLDNFHIHSLYDEIEPMAVLHQTFFLGRFNTLEFLSIRFNPANIEASIASCKKVWDEMVPNKEFDYYFLDKNFREFYKNEKQTSNLLLLFSILAIFIANLGLLGLSFFILEKRTKEITVRKVLGAKYYDLWYLLTKSFFVKLIIANLVSVPISLYLLSLWLQNFAFRIDIQVNAFIWAFVITTSITLITISLISRSKVRMNPVIGLRHE